LNTDLLPNCNRVIERSQSRVNQRLEITKALLLTDIVAGQKCRQLVNFLTYPASYSLIEFQVVLIAIYQVIALPGFCVIERESKMFEAIDYQARMAYSIAAADETSHSPIRFTGSYG